MNYQPVLHHANLVENLCFVCWIPIIGRHEDVNNYIPVGCLASLYFRCWAFNARILKSSQPNFRSWNDVSLDVQMTKLLTSKWPNFWHPNDQSFDDQITKLFIYLSYLLTTEQSLIYSISTATLLPSPPGITFTP